MLVITRKAGESFVIGNDVKVYILHDNNGQIKIGIDAPPEVTILRTELVDKRRNTLCLNK